MNEFDWYGLDNAAKIFPAISDNHTSSVFRIGVRLKNEVDQSLLYEAVNKVLPSFPAFMVRIRKGLFWYYFERNDEKAPVAEENFSPCTRIDADLNAGYLFRFSYYRNKISLDVYHVLSDGTGAKNFLNAVLEYYAKLCSDPHCDISFEQEIPVDFPVMEDSFSKLASSFSPEKPKKIRAYHLRGTPRPRGNIKVIHGILNSDELLPLIKSKNVSVTTYLAAALAFSIYKAVLARNVFFPLRINIPINLRRFYESETQRNFFTFISLDIDLHNKSYTFEELLQLIAEQMEQKVQPTYFMPRINYFIEAEKNIFARITPLFIKNLALRLIYRQSGDETSTCTLSNLGTISTLPSIEKIIDRYDFLLGVSKKNHMNCAVCSYHKQFVISFTKSDYESNVEKLFFRFLSAQGLKVIIEQN